MRRKRSPEEIWRSILLGEVRGLQRIRGVMRRIPAEPRCKLCAAPFGLPGSLAMRVVGFGPSSLNRRLCRGCLRSMDKKPGGAQIELSLLFADVRGSTGLAEGADAQEFSRLMARFYGTAAKAVDRWDGIVDKFVGDEVVALFIPGLAGTDHAANAIAAARDLFRETGAGDDAWIAIGAAIHTGTAYVGVVGEGDARDFTALGDTTNTAARLASSAAAGELLVSSAAAAAAHLDTSGLEQRHLRLRGRSEVVDAWVASSNETRS